MTLIVILLIVALLFGVGAVIEGLFWAFLIAIALVVVGGFLGFSRRGGRTGA